MEQKEEGACRYMKTARQVFEKLISTAIRRRFCGSPDETVIMLARHNGNSIPDVCLPGRIIMRLSDDERELLKGLTSETTNDRQDSPYGV